MVEWHPPPPPRAFKCEVCTSSLLMGCTSKLVESGCQVSHRKGPGVSHPPFLCKACVHMQPRLTECSSLRLLVRRDCKHAYVSYLKVRAHREENDSVKLQLGMLGTSREKSHSMQTFLLVSQWSIWPLMLIKWMSWWRGLFLNNLKYSYSYVHCPRKVKLIKHEDFAVPVCSQGETTEDWCVEVLLKTTRL